MLTRFRAKMLTRLHATANMQMHYRVSNANVQTRFGANIVYNKSGKYCRMSQLERKLVYTSAANSCPTPGQ